MYRLPDCELVVCSWVSKKKKKAFGTKNQTAAAQHPGEKNITSFPSHCTPHPTCISFYFSSWFNLHILCFLPSCSSIYKLTNVVTIHQALVEKTFFLSSCQDRAICLFLIAAGAMWYCLHLPHARPVPGPESRERNEKKMAFFVV